MTTFRYNDPTKGDLHLSEYEGLVIPTDGIKFFFKGKTLSEHMEDLKNLSMRPDDIIVCAFPKSGTHWVWEMINVLLTGKTNKKPKEASMMDLLPTEDLDAIESPRILNTHYPPHLLPKQIKDKKCKLIYIYRNPKDVAVSAHHHYSKAMAFFDIDSGDLQTYIKEFPDDIYTYNYFKYMKEFNQFFKVNPDIPSITLTYEDLTYDPEANVRKLAEFIGVDTTDETIRRTIETCSFNNMKEAESEFKEELFPGSKGKDGESHIFRKGKAGDWKNYFTVADSEAYDTVIEDRLAGLDIKFTFT